jgi:serine/threonine protein kinase
MHRDIKGENIFIDKNKIKLGILFIIIVLFLFFILFYFIFYLFNLGDFGTSRVASKTKKASTMSGT